MELIEYLPEYMREYKEMKEIIMSEEQEFRGLREESSSCVNNFFIETADEKGIKRFENMLGIASGDDESLDYRRFRLKAKFTQGRANIAGILDSILPEGGWNAEYDSGSYKLKVTLDLENKKYLEEVNEALDKAIPANIELECSIFHTTHRILSKYRHSQLADYSHLGLQNIV